MIITDRGVSQGGGGARWPVAPEVIRGNWNEPRREGTGSRCTRHRPRPARSSSLMTMLRLRQQPFWWKVDPPGSILVLRRLTCDRASNLSMWAGPRTHVFGGVQGLTWSWGDSHVIVLVTSPCESDPEPTALEECRAWRWRRRTGTTMDAQNPHCIQHTNTWKSFQSLKIHPCPWKIKKKKKKEKGFKLIYIVWCVIYNV